MIRDQFFRKIVLLGSVESSLMGSARDRSVERRLVGSVERRFVGSVERCSLLVTCDMQ